MFDPIRPTRMYMIGTKPKSEMYTRPYEALGNQSAMNSIGNMIDANIPLTTSTLAKHAAMMMVPSGTPEGQIYVPNGWTTERIRFVMELECTTALGTKYIVVTGYTDYNDPTYSGQVDPAMRLFFNNVVTLRQTTRINDFGQPVYGRAVINTSQLLSVHDGVARFNDYDPVPSPKKTLTPSAVLAQIEVTTSTIGRGIDMGSTFDGRSNVGSGSGITLSRRSNNLAGTYLAETFNVVKDTVNNFSSITGGPIRPNESQIYSQAYGSAISHEASVLDDPFFNLLITRTSYGQRGSVSYGELMSVVPGIDAIAVLARPAAVMQTSAPSMYVDDNGLQHWHQSDIETQLASVLVSGVPALMADCLLGRVTFDATNRTLTGLPEVVVKDISTLLGDNVEHNQEIALVNAFTHRLADEIVPVLSAGGERDFMLSMAVDLAGDTYITIGIGGMAVVSYSAPSYCDNLYVPVVTHDPHRLSMLANDIHAITDRFASQLL